MGALDLNTPAYALQQNEGSARTGLDSNPDVERQSSQQIEVRYCYLPRARAISPDAFTAISYEDSQAPQSLSQAEGKVSYQTASGTGVHASQAIKQDGISPISKSKYKMMARSKRRTPKRAVTSTALLPVRLCHQYGSVRISTVVFSLSYSLSS